MSKQVDSYRFISRSTKRIMQAWAKREPSREIPWSVLAKPLEQCTIALLSSAGIALNNDKPFDQEGERRNPWWGDPSFRIIPLSATEADVSYYHLHVDSSYAEEDINCVFPLRRLEELYASGEIGRPPSSHYSIMGYILQEQELLESTAPKIIDHLLQDAVDAVVLMPV